MGQRRGWDDMIDLAGAITVPAPTAEDDRRWAEMMARADAEEALEGLDTLTPVIGPFGDDLELVIAMLRQAGIPAEVMKSNMGDLPGVSTDRPDFPKFFSSWKEVEAAIDEEA
jgi:hypothetical protein